MKMFGTVALLVTGLGVGMIAQNTLKRRITMLSLFERFLQSLSEQIRHTAKSVADVLRVLAEMPEFLTFLPLQQTVKRLSADGEFRVAWRSAVMEQCRAWALSEQEMSLFLDFSDGLGTADIIGEVHHCEYYSRRVRECLEERKEEARTRSGLYLALGLCGSSAVALLLL